MGEKQYGSVTLNILSLVFNFHKKTEKKYISLRQHTLYNVCTAYIRLGY